MKKSSLEKIAKIQSRGVLTIPKEIRCATGISDNSLVKILGDKYRIIIEPIKTTPYPVRVYSKDEVEDFIKFDAVQTKKLRKNRIL